MSRNGDNGSSGVLTWTARVLSADDLRRSLNGHVELLVGPKTIVTPLASEHLRSKGVRLTRQEIEPAAGTSNGKGWKTVQETQNAVVTSAVAAAVRDGLLVQVLDMQKGTTEKWALTVARSVVEDACGIVAFCQDAGLVCCIANKVKSVRAAAVLTVPQAARAVLRLGANLVAVEMPGRTFFEVRQILRTVCAAAPQCPPAVAGILQELEAHAHR